MADSIHPFVEHGLQFILFLDEVGHFQVDEGQFVVEQLLGAGVQQFHFVVILFVAAVREAEVQDADGVHAFQLVVPYSLWGLFADGEGGVVDAAVFEELLFALLHFYHEHLAVVVLAIDVEYGTAVVFLGADVFGIQVGDVLYLLASVEQGVEKTDE